MTDRLCAPVATQEIDLRDIGSNLDEAAIVKRLRHLVDALENYEEVVRVLRALSHAGLM
jgi:hypothetical protein